MVSFSSKSRTYSSLPDDILIEIFTYLPLYSINKFKCLSNLWLSNLSNPNFIIKWFNINNKSLPWILYHKIAYHDDEENPLRFRKAYHESHSEFMSRTEHLFSCKFVINERQFQGAKLYLLGSSNGLVLCHSVGCSALQRNRYHVCNPLTQTRVSIPSPPQSQVSGMDASGIFCEFSSSFASCYKVVRIPVFNEPSNKFIVDIFSSDLGAWETFQVSCDENVQWRWSNVVIRNGVLYWIEGRDRMLVYNLNQKNGSDGHRCTLINFPVDEFGNRRYYNSVLGESEGWVCYARTRTRLTGEEMTVSVWVLDEVNWQILHKDISLDDILTEIRSRTNNAAAATIQVLGFSPADCNVVLLGCKNLVWGFNIQTRILEELCPDNAHVSDAGRMSLPFVLMPRPTVLLPHPFEEKAEKTL